MWEFQIMFIDTEETDIIYGYDIEDACMREGIYIDDIEVVCSEFIG